MTVGYEVDFMIDNHLNQPVFREEFGAAERWLAGMNAAAIGQNMSVQYCMALPSDLLVSLQNNAVTNYRASDDYAGSSVTNFNLQTSSLLSWALGLRPSKDVFYTSDNLPENPYWRRADASDGAGVDLELHAAIATLSTGPTAIGDGPGRTNETLIRAAAAYGWLLQPAKPPTAVDAQYDGRVAPAGGWAASNGAQVWTTYTSISHAGHTSFLETGASGKPGLGSSLVDADDRRRDALCARPVARPLPGPRRGAGDGVAQLARLGPLRQRLHAVASGCVTLGVPKVHDTVEGTWHDTTSRMSSAVMPSGWVLPGSPTRVATSAVRQRVMDAVESLTVELEGSAGEREHPLRTSRDGAAEGMGSTAGRWRSTSVFR